MKLTLLSQPQNCLSFDYKTFVAVIRCTCSSKKPRKYSCSIFLLPRKSKDKKTLINLIVTLRCRLIYLYDSEIVTAFFPGAMEINLFWLSN